MPIELKDYLNQSDAAHLLKVSRRTVWRWIRSKKIQIILVGGFRMVPRSEVERIVKENSTAVE